MAWESRNGKGSYYTHSKRVNGRVVREYIGTGGIAQAFAEIDALDRQRRELDRYKWQQERDQIKRIDDEICSYFQQVQVVKRQYLEAAGYHQHARGQWRKQRMPKGKPKEQTYDDNQMRADLDKSQRGDEQALARAEKYVTTTSPEEKDTWAAHLAPCHRALIDNIARALCYNGNLFLQKGLKQEAEIKRKELLKDGATSLETLMVNQVVVAWAWSQAADDQYGLLASQGGITLTKLDYYHKIAERSAKRYQSALVDLARIRRLKLPVQQINIAQSGAKQVNIATQNAEITSPMHQNSDNTSEVMGQQDRDSSAKVRDILGAISQ